ncbi:hypothetical protein [Streptomyces rubiginosohelvolus]|uniref:Uncharacterized protein n=1 Tax=Streptomyces rubiginosohelvolus TaxID=67362 RepID=A0ABQ3CCD9_9ACTN|nr:hypothetical protein [Streptomyces pluricolorescens]GGZ82994.1 hypothetical protein GCM10010328_66750 [Streptomyces pluricolorescens]
MAIGDLHQALAALSEDLAAGRWAPHPTECELASYVAVGLQTAAAGAQPEDSERTATRALPEIIRSALREVGPDVATPAVTDGRWAAVVVRCAALVEPERVAGSEEGHRLAVQLLKACVDVAATLQETPCAICYRFALGWHAVPGGDPASTVSRGSAAALFGLHVQSAHPETPAPNPDFECPDCCHFVSYVERSGDDVEVEGACDVSGATVLEQHLYSHLIHRVPVPRPGTARL